MNTAMPGAEARCECVAKKYTEVELGTPLIEQTTPRNEKNDSKAHITAATLYIIG
jgi:hypothetical protein